MRGWARPGSTGTRCRTGPGSAASAATTSATGPAANGGGRAGAHGFLGDTRWWNVRHPNAYATALGDGALPVSDFEVLDPAARHTEDVMLRVRLRSGLPLDMLTADERSRVGTVVADGLAVVDGAALVLTDRGRLLADGVVRTLLAD